MRYIMLFVILGLGLLGCENQLGADTDENGCKASAGYSWCEEKQKCLKQWEEKCEKIVGNDSDEHGCKASAGYSWCEEKQRCIRSFEEDCTLLGGDRDEHGCIGSAGYSWCEEKQKCLKLWEEKCENIVGNDSDEHGCKASAGYSWCEEKQRCIRSFEEDCTLLGGDRDEHGCIGSAGYSWCEEKQRCVRPWEESCLEISNFDECVGAGNPVMESYPRQCSADGNTFTEVLRHVCTEEESKATACTMEYAPVCAEIVLNMGDTVYQTFGNACSACAGMKVIAYTPGECPETSEDMTETEAMSIAEEVCGELECACPEGFRKEGDACNPECYYSTPRCMAPSLRCEKTAIQNEGTGTYWINLAEEKSGCDPACVVDIKTKAAEINWRCTGLACGDCPMFSPPGPDFCTDGTIVSGGVNDCGCNMPPRCE